MPRLKRLAGRAGPGFYLGKSKMEGKRRQGGKKIIGVWAGQRACSVLKNCQANSSQGFHPALGAFVEPALGSDSERKGVR